MEQAAARLVKPPPSGEHAAATATIRGHVAPGFEPVRDALASVPAFPGELAAACAVFRRGEMVVDLWGGPRDPATGAPWESDTLVGFFSVTKAICAVAMAMLHSRGLLDFDAPVARSWPEFAQGGKAGITVRQLLSHQAGLSAIDTPLTPEILADHDRLAQVLARQKPAWEPGSRHGYHAASLGHFENELVRRLDPQRRSIGRFVREEIAGPLGVEFYIGTPAEIPESRFAVIRDFSVGELLYRPKGMPLALVLSAMVPWSLSSRSFLNPRVKRPTDLLRPPYRSLELPSSNGIGTARAVARILGAAASGGGELGLSAGTLAEFEAPPRLPVRGDRDIVLKTRCRYGLGVAKPFPGFRFGGDGRAWGSAGLGGSMGLADPATQTGYAFVPTRSGFYLWDDPRERTVREAVFRCISSMNT